jgi:phosphoglycerol transferase MdoB-like AlkP superfamily enzyme
VQKIKEGNDFDYPAHKTGKMGVQDGDMTNIFIDEINQLKEPFFTNWFTLSSHSPYDQPSSHRIDWAERDNDFLNSVAYTDSCLGIFFNAAKKETWYRNTLFVIMADHGHVSPRNWKYGSSQKLRIPCLLYGEVLKDDFKGTKQAKIGGNLDIASTLLHQLELDFAPEDFPFSKNLLNPYSQDFAPFTMHNGYGWKSKDGEYAFSIASKQDIVFEDSTASVKETGKAYFQIAFEHFYKL